MKIGLLSLETSNAAATTPLQDGSVIISTTAEPWSYCATLGGAKDSRAEVVATVTLEVEEGAIGLLGLGVDGSSGGQERVMTPRDPKVIDYVLSPPFNNKLCLRNVGLNQQSRIRLIDCTFTERKSVDIGGILSDLLPTLLLYPESAIAEVARLIGVDSRAIGALTFTATIGVPIDVDRIFVDELGRFLVREYRRSCELLTTYQSEKMDSRAGYLGPDYFARYFRQSVTRVYHLVKMLRAFGLKSGKVLEVGSLFGTFAGPLQDLGYEMTAVDRYNDFNGALDGYVEDLRSRGVVVIQTTASDETDLIAKLGQFDGVICMAVIEHIPHTPRLFLESLASHVGTDGIVALDTPNIAQYWHRRRLQL